MKIGIVGAGAWGSALAVAISNIAEIVLYTRNHEQAIKIQKTKSNCGNLPKKILFSENVIVTSDFTLLQNVELLIIATPINSMRNVLERLKKTFNSKIFDIFDIFWASKGFEAGTGLLPHQILTSVFNDYDFNYGALLGPSFAQDVALGKITALTLAVKNADFSIKWIKILNQIPNFRICMNLDIIGSEICAASKNIIAIACGIIDGLDIGDNARAALITRSLSEITRLVCAFGGDAKTVYGLTGVGDLFLTCTGNLSRNRRVGLELAKNLKLQNILVNLGHVAEGVSTTLEIYKLSQKLNIDMPIIEAVYDILYQKCPIHETIKKLLLREPKLE